ARVAGTPSSRKAMLWTVVGMSLAALVLLGVVLWVISNMPEKKPEGGNGLVDAGERDKLPKQPVVDVPHKQPIRPKSNDPIPQKNRLDVLYYGVEACSNRGCHGGGKPIKWIRDSKTGMEHSLCRCDEAIRWKGDKERKFPGDK